ncbi:major facilitator superfamily domain-containing protein [Achaetomium macrosporum]|uniref:Major facilitator superfamily domain-containing protein n=1 Tax=Achaetomium macrosporum TaxID=79813 RepID=A0AAN7H8H4_9PEZI|nr:major facilitator superfamily domain-containing protein [Achaetomium macrosporum]
MTRSTSRLRDYLLSAWRTDPAERKLVRKIDFFILTFCCLSYFLNYLDRSNLANAYVSGMKEDLDFHGDQLNQINTCFTVGYVVGQIPSNLSLHYVKPRHFFPAMMVVWAALTMVTASTHSPQAIMAIRFFQGVAEASTFVGTHYILGSWYTERELGKRSGIFTASGLAGTMIGGFIQSGIYTSMDGRHGLRGWRWLFIVDGVITLPVAIYGFFLFPDTPATTTAPYLSPSERELAVLRLKPHSHQHHHPSTSTPRESESEDTTSIESTPKPSPLTWTFAKAVLTSWEWWGFIVLWIIAGETESFSSNSLLALYMKTAPSSPSTTTRTRTQYTVPQLNNYPTGVPAVGIISTLFWAALTDFLGGKRWMVGYFIGVTGVATSGMVLAARGLMDHHPGRATAMVFGAYYWAGSVYACQATFFAWANDVCTRRKREPVFRSVVLAGMNLGSNAVNAWWSVVFYGASMAPWFEKGMYAMIATSVALVMWTAGLSYVSSREERRNRRDGGRRPPGEGAGKVSHSNRERALGASDERPPGIDTWPQKASESR